MPRRCDTWLRQGSFHGAGQVSETVGAVAQAIANADEEDPDFQRIWADAVLVNAQIHAKLSDKKSAAAELRENVNALSKLYRRLESPDRRKEYLTGLARAVRQAEEWEIADQVPAQEWRATLSAEIGDGNAQTVTRPQSPDETPRWLEKSNPKGWPTVAIKSDTLRYALRLPAHWNSKPEVGGTSSEVEHVYQGKRAAEWLIVSFMDKASSTSHTNGWRG